MLREIAGVRQNEGEDRRRWFTDKEWDLYVWYNEADEISGFQLCYDKEDREKAITWFAKRGFSHTKVNFDSEVFRWGGPRMRTSVLVRDGLLDKESVLSRFREDSRNIDPQVVEFVCLKIMEFVQEHR
jgi:hypothetical protein